MSRFIYDPFLDEKDIFFKRKEKKMLNSPRAFLMPETFRALFLNKELGSEEED